MGRQAERAGGAEEPWMKVEYTVRRPHGDFVGFTAIQGDPDAVFEVPTHTGFPDIDAAAQAYWEQQASPDDTQS